MPESILIQAVMPALAGQGLEQLELLETVHHELELLACGERQLLGVEHAFEQQHAIGETGRAQRQTFVEARDGETVGVGECPGRGHEAVAVRIGLDHRHHSAGGRATPR